MRVSVRLGRALGIYIGLVRVRPGVKVTVSDRAGVRVRIRFSAWLGLGPGSGLGNMAGD